MPKPICKIDTSGLKCPLPVLRLARAARTYPSGTHIELAATDPMAEIDIPHWINQQGHKICAQTQKDGILYFTLELK